MADLGDLQRTVDYALESVEQRVERVGRRLLLHWYAGCAMRGLLVGLDPVDSKSVAIGALTCADAMLAALDESSKEPTP